MTKLLLLLSNPENQKYFEKYLAENKDNFEWTVINSAAELRNIPASLRFDVIISDLPAEDYTASDFPGFAGEKPVIALINTGEEDKIAELIQAGAFDFLVTDAKGLFWEKFPVIIEKVKNHKKIIDYYKKEIRTLRENERKYRTIFEKSREAVYITTLEGKFLEFNESMLELFGYDRYEIKNLNAVDLYANAADREVFRKKIENEGSLSDHEVNLRKKDGTEFACLLMTTLLYSDEGKIIGYLGSIKDITQWKQAEKKMAELYEQLKDANISLSFGYAAEKGHKDALKTVLYEEQTGILIDNTGKIIGITEKARETTGKSRLELLHSNFADLLISGSRSQFENDLRSAMIEGAYQTNLILDVPGKGESVFDASIMRINMETQKNILILLRNKETEQ